MSVLGGADGDPDEVESGAAIRLGVRSRAESDATRWGFILVVFMRLLAGLWIFQGLVQWGAVLMPGQPVFDSLPTSSAAAMIFFAVLDLVAAVGLWLATPWGGVLWLFAAFAQIVVAWLIKSFFGTGWIVFNVVLILMYLTLTWQAGRTHGQFSKPVRWWKSRK